MYSEFGPGGGALECEGGTVTHLRALGAAQECAQLAAFEPQHARVLLRRAHLCKERERIDSVVFMSRAEPQARLSGVKPTGTARGPRLRLLAQSKVWFWIAS